MMKESLKEFRHLLFFSLPPRGKVAPKGPDEGAGFGHLVGSEKVNCPAGAKEAGLGHDSARRSESPQRNAVGATLAVAWYSRSESWRAHAMRPYWFSVDCRGGYQPPEPSPSKGEGAERMRGG